MSKYALAFHGHPHNQGACVEKADEAAAAAAKGPTDWCRVRQGQNEDTGSQEELAASLPWAE